MRRLVERYPSGVADAGIEVAISSYLENLQAGEATSQLTLDQFVGARLYTESFLYRH